MRLLLALFLVSCALPTPVKRSQKLAADKMEACITKFIGKFNIKAKTALEVCEVIHKKVD